MAKIDEYKFTSDGISQQDKLMADMLKDLSPEQIRLYRQNALKTALQTGNHASQHNDQQKALKIAIQQGERLTNRGLEKLIKQAKSGAGIDAAELLDFTLGNTKRNQNIQKMRGLKNSLSYEVLEYYLANIKKASQHFTGGISSRQVIDQSRPIDIKRANEQIFLATTFKRKGNVIYWLTNAGPQNHLKSDKRVLNHKVVTELLDYPILMTGRSNIPSREEIKNLLVNGKIKFDCDCGRHQYWYRYIATVGKFNFGSHENRYPSTRNPQLTGVACKHVLRVMQQMSSEYAIGKIREYIKADLKNIDGKTMSKLHSKADIKKESEKQARHKSAENWSKKIEQKIKQHLKIAFKQLSEPTEMQVYNRIKSLQNVAPNLISSEQKQIMKKFETGNTPFRGNS